MSHNLFAYCQNNPINTFDPSGKDTQGILSKLGALAWLPLVDGPLPIGDLALGVIGIALIIDAHITVTEMANRVKTIVDSTTLNGTFDKYTIYVLRDPLHNGMVKYVGRTNDYHRRMQEHKRDPRKSRYYGDPIWTCSSLYMARIIEQATISSYLIANLDNARREIAIGRLKESYDSMQAASEIMSGVAENELYNLMKR